MNFYKYDLQFNDVDVGIFSANAIEPSFNILEASLYNNKERTCTFCRKLGRPVPEHKTLKVKSKTGTVTCSMEKEEVKNEAEHTFEAICSITIPLIAF